MLIVKGNIYRDVGEAQTPYYLQRGYKVVEDSTKTTKAKKDISDGKRKENGSDSNA